MWVRSALAAGAALLLAARPAPACGPFFPTEVLREREITLLTLPSGTFDYELRRVVGPARAGLPVVERPGEDPAAERRAAEHEGVSQEDAARIAAMRAAPADDAAWAAGEGLPAAIRAYTAGAVAFGRTFRPRTWPDDPDDAAALPAYPTGAEYDAAVARTRAYFDAVLALPPDAARARIVWATFMLGRVDARAGDPADARRRFAAVRDLVRGGAPDPLGLAVASLGEEARLQLDGGDVPGAVALYVEQASYGSGNALISLRQVARRLWNDEAALTAALADPLTRRLIVGYAFARGPEEPAAVLILGALEQAGVEQTAGADRLAAVAYQEGQWERAARLAALDPTPLSAWVQAKLALRRGDQPAALAAYAEAARGFPLREVWHVGGDTAWAGPDGVIPHDRIGAERGVLAMTRADYPDALDRLFAAGELYWLDAAYVAERVLTVDELLGFVRDRVPAPHPLPTPDEYGWTPTSPAVQLRRLLARRLMRTGRWDEALPYFDDPATRAAAGDYVGARRRAGQWWRGDVTRATAWYRAASAARFDGIDVLAFERDPDWAVWDGNFSGAAGIDGGPIRVLGPVLGDDERARALASAADPDVRLHYRVTATEHAARAADLLPARSQAFAAVLCHATGWLIDRDADRARALYRRYVAEGALVPFGAHFGRSCPEPDWDGARRRQTTERMTAVQRAARRGGPAAATVLVFLAVAALWRRRGRARR